MKEKTARRFIKRNYWKFRKCRLFGIKNAFTKRFDKAVKEYYNG